MRLLFVLLLIGCAPKVDNSYLQMNVTCPKESGLMATPMLVECKCSDPGSARKGGLMSVIGGTIGYAVETLTD